MAVSLPMVRVGDCSRCGECCRPDPSGNNNPLFTDAEREDPDRVEGFCPMYRVDSDGLGTCLGYGTHPYYLSGCQGHPYGPQDLVATPGCTFQFEAA